MRIGCDVQQLIADGLEEVQEDIELKEDVGGIASAQVSDGLFEPKGGRGVLLTSSPA